MYKPLVLVALAFGTSFAAPKSADETTVANAKSFDTALAKQKLAKVALVRTVNEHADLSTKAVQAPGFVDLVVTAGWRAEEELFVTNAKHQVFRVVRAPHVTQTITEQLGCRKMSFAGGRGWFEHHRFALPKGATYAGTITIAYDTTEWKQVDATKQPDGTPCPAPEMAVD